MTGAEYGAIARRCAQFWRSTLRGMLLDEDFNDFVQAVALAVAEGKVDAPTLGNVCRAIITDMRRAQQCEKDGLRQARFEAVGNKLPRDYPVPHYSGWGGARANSGGKRPGAGRPRKA